MHHRFPTGWRLRLPFRPRSRGQALVELALILPVMLVLFASALDLGRLFYSQITIANAAKEGALEASRHPTSFDNTKPCDATTNRVICLVINEAKGSFYSITPADVSLTCSPSPCPSVPVVGNTVTVKVTGKFTLITPLLASFLGGQTINISSSAVAYLGVAPEPAAGSTTTPTATASPTPTASSSASPTPTPSGSVTPTPTPVCVTPTVTGSMTVSPTSGGYYQNKNFPGTEFTFTAPTANPQAGCTFTYTWSFGDGGSGDGTSTTHTYSAAGSSGTGNSRYFPVTLTISVYGVPVNWQGTINVPVF